jgi:hypothetical protein
MRLVRGWAFLLFAMAMAVPSAGAAFEAGSPEDTVFRYLGALKDGKFETAYDVVSKAMRGGKSKDAWSKEQRAMAAFADVKIFDFKVQPGKVEGATAKVPNILSSQDRFINQMGLTEYELYTLVREDGAWKVDSQLLVETPDLPKWFPTLRKSAQSTDNASPH